MSSENDDRDVSDALGRMVQKIASLRGAMNRQLYKGDDLDRLQEGVEALAEDRRTLRDEIHDLRESLEEVRAERDEAWDRELIFARQRKEARRWSGD